VREETSSGKERHTKERKRKRLVDLVKGPHNAIARVG
jgi:hypothetical protein